MKRGKFIRQSSLLGSAVAFTPGAANHRGWENRFPDLGEHVSGTVVYSAIDSVSAPRAVCQTRSTDKIGTCCS